MVYTGHSSTELQHRANFSLISLQNSTNRLQERRGPVSGGMGGRGGGGGRWDSRQLEWSSCLA